MKASVPLIVLMLAVTGCHQRETPPAQVQAVPDPSVAQMTEAAPPPAPKCATGTGYESLPTDVCLPESYEVSKHLSYTDSQGRARMRVVFGYSRQDAEGVVSSMTLAMKSAGYRVYPRVAKEDGSISIPFTKKESGTTYLEVKQLPPSGDGGQRGVFFLDFLSTGLPVASATLAPTTG